MRSRPATLLRTPSIRFPSGEETAIVQSLVPGNSAHADLLVWARNVAAVVASLGAIGRNCSADAPRAPIKSGPIDMTPR